MVQRCDYQHAEFLPAPLGFEPGTPNIANIIAFAATLNWLQSLDSQAIAAHEAALHQQLLTGRIARNANWLAQLHWCLMPQVHHADSSTAG